MADPELFFPIITDVDKGEFSIEGRTSDDTPWVKAVVGAKANGRTLTCNRSDKVNRAQAAAEVSQQFPKLREVAAGSIVDRRYD